MAALDTEARKLPNFFLVGAMRSGSTSVYYHLLAHPHIYTSRIKEPNYFATDLRIPLDRRHRTRLAEAKRGKLNRVRVSDFDEYLGLFEGASSELAIGECSVAYLYSKTAAAEIRSMIPHARILMVLRNPVQRAYSHYLMHVRNAQAKSSFRDEMNRDLSTIDDTGMANPYIETGLYYEQIKRYLGIFPRDQVKIFLTEDMRDDLYAFLSSLYEFLGVDSSFRPPATIYNEAKVPRSTLLNQLWSKTPLKGSIVKHLPQSVRDIVESLYNSYNVPKMSEVDREYLITVFAPEIRRLEPLINRDLANWLK
ncbi:MAG TPA: sulfotransferase [Candidatus Binataceae bacterium]